MKNLPMIPEQSPNLPHEGGSDPQNGTALDGLVADPVKTDELRPAIHAALKKVYDPEIPVDILELGLIYDVFVTAEGVAGIKMTLTAPGCGMGPAIAHDAQSKILTIDGVDEADVQLVWDPPWNQSMISEAGRMKLGMV
jgi:metal-sulfur cluster biosynthetic enzyme